MVNVELAADTEMLEAVCEVNSDHWVGSFSASQKAAVKVAPELLATYVGVYTGPYAGRLRTVEITLVDGELLATPFMGRDKRLLVAESDSQFLNAEGLVYQFVRDQRGLRPISWRFMYQATTLTSASVDPIGVETFAFT